MDPLSALPITEESAPSHLQRAWYVALGSAGVMLLGGVFTTSFNLFMGGVIVIGLGHGMLQRSWVAAGALAFYLVGVLVGSGWSQERPLLVLLAIAVGYFLVQGVRAVWFLRGREPVANRIAT